MLLAALTAASFEWIGLQHPHCARFAAVNPSLPRTAPPLLGVPGFCSWMDEKAPDALTPISGGLDADVIAFDLNAILHAVLRRASDEQHALTLVFQRLHATLRLVRPGATVILALDGPAPVAKVATQRARRLKTQRKDEKIAAARARDAKAAKSSKKKKREQGISSLLATPGTYFMADLENALLYFVCSELSTWRARGLSFLISGADVPGEGEIKLLGALHRTLQPPPPEQQPLRRRGGRRRHVVLVGMDGDLVLQALTLVGGSRWEVSVLRNLPSRGEQPTVVSIAKLCQQFGLRQGGGGGEAEGGEAEGGEAEGGEADALLPSALDLIGLSCLMGNDYLPKIREASFERLWRAYLVLRQLPQFRGAALLVNGPPGREVGEEGGSDAGADEGSPIGASLCFNYAYLAAILIVTQQASALAAARALHLVETGGYEPSAAKAEAAMTGLDAETINLLAQRAAQDVAAAEAGSTEPPAADPRLSSSVFATTRFDTRAYLSGVLFTVQMYVDGVCPDYAWEYTHPHAPTAANAAAMLLKELRARSLADGISGPPAATSAAASAAPIAAPIAAPESSALALPSPIVAGLVLPAGVASQLAPPPLAAQMQPGGLLSFSEILEAAEEQAAAIGGAGEREAGGGGGDGDGGGGEGGNSSLGLTESGENFVDQQWSRGQLTRAYPALLAAAEELPPDRAFDRCRLLAATPAWLELRRARGGFQQAAAQPKSSEAAGAAQLPQLPQLPPEPPTPRMTPLRLRPDEISCRWVRALSRRGSEAEVAFMPADGSERQQQQQQLRTRRPPQGAPQEQQEQKQQKQPQARALTPTKAQSTEQGSGRSRGRARGRGGRGGRGRGPPAGQRGGRGSRSTGAPDSPIPKD